MTAGRYISPETARAVCERKVYLPTVVAARYRALLEMKRRPDVVLYVYKCWVCSGWHLTTHRSATAVDVRPVRVRS